MGINKDWLFEFAWYSACLLSAFFIIFGVLVNSLVLALLFVSIGFGILVILAIKCLLYYRERNSKHRLQEQQRRKSSILVRGSKIV